VVNRDKSTKRWFNHRCTISPRRVRGRADDVIEQGGDFVEARRGPLLQLKKETCYAASIAPPGLPAALRLLTLHTINARGGALQRD
jgi:hypothetical protein